MAVRDPAIWKLCHNVKLTMTMAQTEGMAKSFSPTFCTRPNLARHRAPLCFSASLAICHGILTVFRSKRSDWSINSIYPQEYSVNEMTSSWEIAAVVGPLVFAFVAMIVTGVVSASPAAIAFFQRSTRRILSYALPSRGRCHRLFLKDFPPEHIHRCHSGCQHVNPQAALVHDPANCWEDSVGKVFNQAWPSVQKDSNTVPKPYHLPLFQDFIQTDVQTLMAFLILTVNICRTCETADVKSMLDIKAYGGIITVHLKAHPLAPANTTLTKFEVERMIEGYPPFYRSTFSITGLKYAAQLSSPISMTHHENISRGAWVLAVGLSISDGPIPSLYIMKQLRQKNNDAYWKGTLVMSAFEMIGHTLGQLRDSEWSWCTSRRPDDEARWKDLCCGHALTCYNLIMDSGWSSKPWILKTEEMESQELFRSLIGECPCTRTCLGKNAHSETCGRGQTTRKDAAKRLSLEQCKAALEIFNNYNHSEENREIIFPVLLEVLQTVILGMCEVEHYFSTTGQHLDLPEILKGQRHIYLRTCASDND